MTRHVVARTDEIPPGGRKLVSVRGRPIAIFHLADGFYGLLNRCPHQGGSLCEGLVTGLVESPEPGVYAYRRAGEILRCPWHGWEFDIRTGRSVCDPDGTWTRRYEAAAVDGAAVAAGGFVAETIAVRIEDDYVVVEA